MGLDRPLDEVTQADLQELVDNRVAEKRVIDYKQELHFSTDKERKEFLFDIASFANAGGGHLLYGISEVDGYPEPPVGIGVESEDELIRQVESRVREGIAPRVRVEVGLVGLDNGSVVLILRIPSSWAKPHMVTFKGTNKFYGRDSRGKYPLDVAEIRAAFALGASAAEQARAFRVDRVATILSGRTTPALVEGPTTILHLIPLQAFQPGAALRSLPRPDDLRGLRPLGSTGWNPSNNFEGVVVFGSKEWDSAETGTYVQLFRSGAIEAAKVWRSQAGSLPSQAYERAVLDALPKYLQTQRDLGIDPPILVMLTMARMKGVSMAVSAFERTGLERAFADSEMLVPEGVLETFDDPLEPLMRRLFDVVWNAAGSSGSLNFDAEGRWVERE